MGTTIAVDLAKSVFEVAVSNRPGRITERHRLTRAQFSRFVSGHERATVLMEACGSAHFWARHAEASGHRAVLLPPHAVRPYVPRNKTDRADTEGLLEASRNERIHPVPVKSVAQQTITVLHRLRSAWVATRTSRINVVRGLLRELGITIPVGAGRVAPRVRLLIADASPLLPVALRPSLESAAAEIVDLEKKILAVEAQLRALALQTPVATELQTIPGVGLLTSTALFAFVGSVDRFPSGRHFASYLGITPREHSSGSRRHLGSISKRGDAYLRTLLIHGARSILCRAKKTPHPNHLQTWALRVERKRGHNRAAVALANKLARIAWAVWKTGSSFTDEQYPRVAPL